MSCQAANLRESVAKIQCNISRTISRLKVQRSENFPWHPPVPLLTNRAKLIVELPRNLTSFRIISSESISSTFLIIAINALQKHYFQSFLIYFGPMMQRFVLPCSQKKPKNPKDGIREWLFGTRLTWSSFLQSKSSSSCKYVLSKWILCALHVAVFLCPKESCFNFDHQYYLLGLVP